MSAEKWFYRGKEARALNQPRAIKDSRLSAESRQQFLAGWDEQDRQMQPEPTDAERTEAASVRQRLREFAKTL